MVDANSRGKWVWGLWGLSVSSSQIFWKSKTVLKNKVYFKFLNITKRRCPERCLARSGFQDVNVA